MSTHPGGAISTKWIASTLAMGFARPVGAVPTNRRPDSNRHHRADVMKNRFGRPRSLLDVVKPTSRKWEVQLEYQFSENKNSAQSCKRSAGRLVGAWVQVDCRPTPLGKAPRRPAIDGRRTPTVRASKGLGHVRDRAPIPNEPACRR